MKIYDLPRDRDKKIYVEDKVVIFGHVDGMYSYCWLEEDKSKLVHLACYLELEDYKDGYKIKEVEINEED